MRAKQSFTATGMQSTSVSFTPQPTGRAHFIRPQGCFGEEAHCGGRLESSAGGEPLQSEAAARGEGLLHDARNLLGTLGLYCDLLERPGVLKPEHRHYAAEVRLVGVQSGDLLERLVALADSAERDAEGRTEDSPTAGLKFRAPVAAGSARPAQAVSLRAIVERCSGLLSRVAGGREIEIAYGPASAVLVPVSEESVVRILVNLVRNAAAALEQTVPAGDGLGGAAAGGASAQGSAIAERTGPRRLREPQDPTSDETDGAIRIGVGLLVNRAGDAKPWPFRRVRLVVEDAGRGMSPERLDRLLTGRTAQVRGGHGIGFRVVRDLVAASNGDLSAMSAPGIGTRVQIEWPMAAPSASEEERSGCGLAEEVEPAVSTAASFGERRRVEGSTPTGARQTLRWPPGEVASTPKASRAVPRTSGRGAAGVPSAIGDLVPANRQETKQHGERVDA